MLIFVTTFWKKMQMMLDIDISRSMSSLLFMLRMRAMAFSTKDICKIPYRTFADTLHFIFSNDIGFHQVVAARMKMHFKKFQSEKEYILSASILLPFILSHEYMRACILRYIYFHVKISKLWDGARLQYIRITCVSVEWFSRQLLIILNTIGYLIVSFLCTAP